MLIGFQLEKKEIDAITAAFKDKGDATGFKSISASGFNAGGEKFVTIKADERSLYGKKVSCHATRST